MDRRVTHGLCWWSVVTPETIPRTQPKKLAKGRSAPGPMYRRSDHGPRSRAVVQTPTFSLQSSALPTLTWTQFHALFLEKYVHRTLTDRKKDKFMDLSKVVLSVHMTSVGKSFHEVTDFVKKVEAVKQDSQTKALAKKAKNSGNFHGSYSRGSGRPTLAARPIQFNMSASTGGRRGNQLGRGGSGNGNAGGGAVQAGREVARKNDKAQCYAFPGKIEAEASDAMITVEVESPFIKSIPVVSKFREVFHTDLSSMPLDRDINLCIDLEPGTRPIYIPPYHMAPTELRELNAQIQELLDKGFIRCSASLWGAPLFKELGLRMCPRRRLVTEVRSFVGLASNYHRFVKNFASIATHLTNLTKKKIPFEWTEKCKESFQKFVTLLTTAPILALPVEGKDFIVYCDASHSSLGAVLM
ncbi:hypothetical protein MTR67_052536 [Solanum verrucosum]|uniref:Reverse transcriptase/retrotransposon-derived protein RNase H-like domain-containing protein n=1 Tax=Solanum verrucosum TaxID=315347 RepID=A0AAF0V993_SOLVR|nr:hypothetical protein MTR67_052536 [Solanum verrucosum]